MALTDNLVAYYKLDGNSNDSVGSNNGTDTNISYVAGKINNSASLNGSSSYIQTPYSNASSEFTNVFWFKCAASTTSNQTLSGQTTSALLKYWFLIGRNNHPTFPRKLVALVGGGTALTMYGTTNVDDGNWHMGAIVLKSGASALYVDGNLEDSDTTSYTVPTTSMPTHYFGKTGDNDSYLNGLLDESGIWSRALTSTEITQLYNSGAGLQYPFSTSTPNFLPFFQQIYN